MQGRPIGRGGCGRRVSLQQNRVFGPCVVHPRRSQFTPLTADPHVPTAKDPWCSRSSTERLRIGPDELLESLRSSARDRTNSICNGEFIFSCAEVRPEV